MRNTNKAIQETAMSTPQITLLKEYLSISNRIIDDISLPVMAHVAGNLLFQVRHKEKCEPIRLYSLLALDCLDKNTEKQLTPQTVYIHLYIVYNPSREERFACLHYPVNCPDSQVEQH